MSKPRNRPALPAVFFLIALGVSGQSLTPASGAGESPYAKWTNGPSRDSAFFPIGVWLQDPGDARSYEAAGINLYVGLWKGPTEEQLNQLNLAGMPVICEQNETGLRYHNEKIIIGWMHPDEPDNAQPLPFGLGHGFPVPPQDVKTLYQKMQEADPSRPVLLNLGQGVAWDGWYGRGHRSRHPEDYPLYVQGCDIASFDIYPVAHTEAAVSGRLWYVAEGVKRLVGASNPPKIVWNVIEAAGALTAKRPTPHQIRAEVWMSLIHGSRGIVYFVHEWKPEFCSRVLLEDPELLKGVTRINTEVRRLAPVLNSLEPPPEAKVTSTHPEVPLAALAKRLGEADYLFAVAMRDRATTGEFRIEAPPTYCSAEVLGESRTLQIVDGAFSDTFQGYDVHLYQLRK